MGGIEQADIELVADVRPRHLAHQLDLLEVPVGGVGLGEDLAQGQAGLQGNATRLGAADQIDRVAGLRLEADEHGLGSDVGFEA